MIACMVYDRRGRFLPLLPPHLCEKARPIDRSSRLTITSPVLPSNLVGGVRLALLLGEPFRRLGARIVHPIAVAHQFDAERVMPNVANICSTVASPCRGAMNSLMRFA